MPTNYYWKDKPIVQWSEDFGLNGNRQEIRVWYGEAEKPRLRSAYEEVREALECVLHRAAAEGIEVWAPLTDARALIERHKEEGL